MKKLIRRSKLKGRKLHGFRSRSKTKGGRKILARRRRGTKRKPYRAVKAKKTKWS